MTVREKAYSSKDVYKRGISGPVFQHCVKQELDVRCGVGEVSSKTDLNTTFLISVMLADAEQSRGKEKTFNVSQRGILHQVRAFEESRTGPIDLSRMDDMNPEYLRNLLGLNDLSGLDIHGVKEAFKRYEDIIHSKFSGHIVTSPEKVDNISGRYTFDEGFRVLVPSGQG